MEKQKKLLILSLILNILLFLLAGFLILLQFGVIDLNDKVKEENGNDNLVTEEERLPEENALEESDPKQEDEEEESKHENWTVYMNEEMGFQISYPDIETINGNTISLALMERENDRLKTVNCVEIGPVENDQKAQISIGYEPAEKSPDICFRSSVGGELITEDFGVIIGDQFYQVEKTIYKGLEENEESFIQFKVFLDNPNMSEDEYENFAIEVEYYLEYEDMYSGLYEEILKTFRWL